MGPMHTVKMALEAMATRFELVLMGSDAPSLRAAGEEALAEIAHMEARLSFYRPTSEVSRINRAAASGPVRVSACTFRLLQRAAAITESTGGAFDITVAPLMKCWGFVRGRGHWPARDALQQARSVVGMQHVVLNEPNRSVAFLRDGLSIDLGGIGKGYAIDEAASILKECGVNRALLHGGTSSVFALGAPPDEKGWRVAVPLTRSQADGVCLPQAVVTLNDEALSVSAVWGKAFQNDGIVYGHVIDPRSGMPVAGAELAAVVHPSAADADALATALMVMGTDERSRALQNFGTLRFLVTRATGPVVAHGIDIRARVPIEAPC